MPDIYIDAEWYPKGQIFLLGWCTSPTNKGALYGQELNGDSVEQLLAITLPNHNVYCYGPDIGKLEREYDLNLKDVFNCVNLLSAFRKETDFSSFALATLEEHYEIKRTTKKYKKDIFQALKDWEHPTRWKYVVKYNMEDVVNLLKVKRKVCGEYKITRSKLKKYTMTK